MTRHFRLPGPLNDQATRAPVIRTDHIRPPIPDFRFDWCAWYDGEEEDGSYGYGRTEREAVTDLLDNWPRDEDEAPEAHHAVEDEAPTCNAPWWLIRP